MPPAYDVPGHGPLVYCGLQGVASLLAEVMPRDELAHLLCENLRAGDWLADYIASRVEREPRYLVPAYFAERALQLYREVAREVLVCLAPADCATGSLWRALALTSVQLAGAVPGATLPRPRPRCRLRPRCDLTLSAGLPHFAEGYMRC